MNARRSTVVLVGINVLLLATLVAGLSARGRTRDDTEPLFGFAVSEAGRVVISSWAADGVRTIVLDRAEDWDLAEAGVRYPARADRVRPFLEELDRARIVRTVGSGSGLIEQFALIAPGDGQSRSGTRVDISAGSSGASVLFGDRESVSDQVYVRAVDDDRVDVARAAVGFYLEQPATFWAYLRLFPESVRPDDVVRVEASVEGGAMVVLTRDVSASGEQWFVESEGRRADARLPADAESADALARDLADLVGDGFYEEAAFGTLPGVATVSFSTSGGRSFGVEVRAAGDLLVARPIGPALPGAPYGGLLYTIPSSTLGRIVPERSELIAR